MDARPGLVGFFQLHRPNPPTDKKRRLALVFSYAPDWQDSDTSNRTPSGLFFLLNTIEPFKREFSLNDTSIQHTYAVHERISDAHLVLIALVAPLLLMAVMNLISIRSFWDLHTSWLGVLLSLAITGSITNIVKVTVGRPRPDCIDRCQPEAGASDNPVFGLVNATICTQTDNTILKDGFRSFPSGHSSLSFAGLGFLFFYAAGKLHLYDKRGYTLKAWISLVPLIGAALVAISRTMDYRHHWQDVLIGGLIGLAMAWFSYRQYYPPLADPLSHRPYSPRIPRQTTMPHLLQDEDHQETDNLHSSDGQHYNDDLELRGGSFKNSSAVPKLTDMWREGEGQEILPPGQSPSPPPPQRADENV
ncbi:PAP2-domain-containing protein [Hysterangium stoloniferum]|nr:PAP2-domain-containing protein [Hysterangium stoloniferum]